MPSCSNQQEYGEPSSLLASNAECNQLAGSARRDDRVEAKHVEAWVDEVVFSNPAQPVQTDSSGWHYLSFTKFQGTNTGPVQARVGGTVGGCTVSGSVSGEAGPAFLFLYNFTLGGQVHRTYWGSAVSIVPFQHKYTCPNDTHFENNLVGPWLYAPPEQLFHIQSDGATLGEVFQSPEDPDTTFTWLLASK